MIKKEECSVTKKILHSKNIKNLKIMEIKKRLSSIIESPSHNTTEKLEKFVIF